MGHRLPEAQRQDAGRGVARQPGVPARLDQPPGVGEHGGAQGRQDHQGHAGPAGRRDRPGQLGQPHRHPPRQGARPDHRRHAAAPPEVVEERAAWIFNKLNGYGITGIVTAQLDPVRLKAYRTLESKDKLTVRIQGSWDFNTRYVTTTLEEQSKTFMTRDKRGKNSPLINVDGVKIYMDGVPNDAEGGSPMIDRYATAPTFGTPSIDESTFSTWMLRFDKEGLKVMAHATGSLSVRHFLNAVEAVRRANGKGPTHHMAHSMLIYPDEVDRFNFERSNFVAEVSPYQLWTPDPAIRHWTNHHRPRPLRPDDDPAQDHHRRGRRGDLRQRLGQHS